MKQKIFFIILVCLASSEEIIENDLEKAFGDNECIEGKLVFGGSSLLLIKMTSDSNEEAKINMEDTKIEEAVESKHHILVSIPMAVEQAKSPLMLLNEIAQVNRISIDYLIVSEEGLPHERTFNLRLNLGDEVYYAKEKSIKQAKLAAVLLALSQTKYVKPTNKSSKKAVTVVEQTPTVLLNNIATKLGLKVEYISETNTKIHKLNNLLDNKETYLYLDKRTKTYIQKLNATLGNTRANNMNYLPSGDKSPKGPFKVRLNVGGKTFFGVDTTIQGAKHKAAQGAIEVFKRMSLKEVEECLDKREICNKLSIKSPISLVYETAIKRGLSVHFEVTQEAGPAHKKLFVTMCKVGDLLTKGQGPSKGESKKKAAEKMLTELDSLEPILVGSSINVKSEDSEKKKRKKKKIARGYIDNVKMNLLDSIASVTSAFNSKDRDNVNDDDHKTTKKNELLELSNNAGFNVHFSLTESNGKYSSLVSLDLDPSYVCLSQDISKELAEEQASENALRIIKKMGFNNIIVPNRENRKENKPEISLYTKEEPEVEVVHKI